MLVIYEPLYIKFGVGDLNVNGIFFSPLQFRVSFTVLTRFKLLVQAFCYGLLIVCVYLV